MPFQRPRSARHLGSVLTAMFVAAWILGAAPEAQKANVAQTPKVTAGDKIFGLTKVHKLHITVPASEWAALQTSSPRGGGSVGGQDYRAADGRLIHVGSGFGGYFPWARADLRVDGLEFKDVGLRYKGNLSFSSSSISAPLFANFKLKIDTHGTKGTWDGEKTFNLHAGVVDNSRMRDAVAFSLFRAAGVPAPRTAFAELVFTVPGVYNETSAGIFALIEDVNKKFLERVLPPGTGLLMKPEGMRGGVQSLGENWSTYVPTLRPDRDATPLEQQRYMELGRLVSQTDNTLFRSKVREYLDVDEFLRFIAVNAIIANNDSYLRGGHNFYLYLDSKDGKLRFIPWDQDLSMGTRGGAGLGAQTDPLRPYSGDQPLIYWLLDDPEVAAQYRLILREITTQVFTKAKMTEMMDALESVFATRTNTPRPFLDSRVDYMQQLVAAWGGR